jgi:hypothetical protein
MKRVLAAIVTAACCVAPAYAQSALVKCDGFPRRVDTAESVARGVLALGTLGLSGMGERPNPSARLKGAAGVTACSEALGDSTLTGNPVRRAEVYLARGIHSLEAGNAADAERDARSGLAVELPAEWQAQAARTLHPSLKLLAAIARLSQGDQPGAEALALEAMAARPGGSLLHQEGLAILALSTDISGAEADVLDRRALKSSSAVAQRARQRLGAADYAGAAADYRMVKDAAREPWAQLFAQLALAQALAGDSAGADASIADAQEAADKLAIVAQGSGADARDAALAVSRADEFIQLARARQAVSAGRIDEARTLLSARTRWLVPAEWVAPVLESAGAGKGWAAPLDPAKLRADSRRAAADKVHGKGAPERLMLLLPRFEDADPASDIGKALAKPGGDSVKPAPTRDASALRIGLTTRMAQVDTQDEALLLVAAQQAQKRGMPRFAIVGTNLSYISLERGGPSSVGGWIEIVFPEGPGAKLYESQAGRSLDPATVVTEYGPLFAGGPAGGR